MGKRTRRSGFSQRLAAENPITDGLDHPVIPAVVPRSLQPPVTNVLRLHANSRHSLLMHKPFPLP